jgi:hypothetical protein
MLLGDSESHNILVKSWTVDGAFVMVSTAARDVFKGGVVLSNSARAESRCAILDEMPIWLGEEVRAQKARVQEIAEADCANDCTSRDWLQYCKVLKI